MKLYVVSGRAKLAAVLSIFAFIMIAAVSSSDLTGKGLNPAENHFKNDELKVQGVTSEQWGSASVANSEAAVTNTVSGEKPGMSSENNVLYTIVAAAAIGEAYPVNDDPDPAGGEAR